MLPPANNVAGYFERIGIVPSSYPDPLALLQAVHVRHSFTVPFENLSIILGQTPSLRYEDLWQKIVADKRGGYCYELNGLLCAVLKQLSFDVTLLSARILFGAQGVFARGHKLLLVKTAGERWLADVGYRNGLLGPFPLVPGTVQWQGSETFRLVQADGLFVLQKQVNGDWTDLYSFTLDPQLPVDFEPHNFYNACSPASIFTRMRIVSLKTDEGSVSLLDNVLVEMKRGKRMETPVESEAEYKRLLHRIFGISLEDEIIARLYHHTQHMALA